MFSVIGNDGGNIKCKNDELTKVKISLKKHKIKNWSGAGKMAAIHCSTVCIAHISLSQIGAAVCNSMGNLRPSFAEKAFID